MNSNQIKDLICRSKQNDAVAFRQLVTEYQPLVFRLGFRLLCNEDEAKDIVQETFIKVWLHLHHYKEHFKFSTWIYRIACNLCYDKLRKMKYFQENVKFPDMAGLNIPSDENLESLMINQELSELIKEFTQYLTPKQRLVFTLKDIEDLEVEEIKEITGMSSAKVKSNLYLARQCIRNKINKIM